MVVVVEVVAEIMVVLVIGLVVIFVVAVMEGRSGIYRINKRSIM